MATERTLIIVKPDAVQRGLTGEIIKRFEQRGLRIIGMKFMQVSRELAEKHYDVHRERPFFASLVDYIISSPVVVLALEGTDAIVAARNTIGATKPIWLYIAAEDCRILDTWHVMGLRGSGSDDFEVEDAFVPYYR